MPAILAYLFYFIVASASPLQRRWLAKTKNPENSGQIDFAFRVTLIIAVLGSISLPFISPFKIEGDIYLIAALAAIVGLFGVGFWTGSYVAQKHVEAGVTSLVGNIYTPITIILSPIFFGEGLTPTQILGTVILLSAVVMVSKKHRIGRFKFDKYFLLMLGSGVMLGFLLVAERALQRETGWAAGTLIAWWSECLFLGLAVLATKSRHSYSTKDVGITSVLRFFQQLSWVLLILIVGNLSIVSSITTFKVVVIFIAAAVFLKEREDLSRKIVGSLIAVVGLLLMK